ncbi:YhcN/YlaJ family sporulation lipoprotein [Halalkalibacterium ligniniphilum]|uniref:YhcN/YlaJ family sporulation lipoprotein n=1 Tax=Halalkalibacterium ligniniphilum TaxID=1134413 RepID=UPI000381F582|nr:YhcN/YlaJ family sporulation lipoprotein [Halalkalibacterium ligniniphilum]
MQRLLMFLLLGLFCLQGCTVEQEEVLGANANANREEGFKGYGTQRVQALLGPLSDLMVPDKTTKGFVYSAHLRANVTPHLQGKRDEGMGDEGFLTLRPGVTRDKYILRDSPQMRQKKESKLSVQESHSLEGIIKSRIERLENVHHAYVLSDENDIVIGVESKEQNRPKLYRTIRESIKDLVDVDQVTITTSHSHINRMNALEKGMQTSRPFEDVGGFGAEMVDFLKRNRSR